MLSLEQSARKESAAGLLQAGGVPRNEGLVVLPVGFCMQMPRCDNVHPLDLVRGNPARRRPCHFFGGFHQAPDALMMICDEHDGADGPLRES